NKSNSAFWKHEAQSTRDAHSRLACWWMTDKEPRWHRIAGMALRGGQTEGRVLCRGSPGVEEKGQRESQCGRRGLSGSISHGKLESSLVTSESLVIQAQSTSHLADHVSS